MSATATATRILNAEGKELDGITDVSIPTVWSKPGCVQCISSDRHMDSAGLEHAYLDLTKEENLDTFTAFVAAGIKQAPVLQFPEVVRDGETIFEARAVTGFRVDIIDQYIAAVRGE